MIYVYLLKSFAHTPFKNENDLQYLKENQIEIVDNVKSADIIVCQNYKHLNKYFFRYLKSKKYIVWTLESRFDTNFKTKVKAYLGLFNCQIMNVYTRDVFVNNLTFHSGLINKKLELISQDFKIDNRRIVALMSYFKGIDSPTLLRNAVNIDLIGLRSKIGIKGNSRGVLDIYGKGWPNGVSQEDSRDGEWVVRKQEILEKYNFNLCFENTIAYNYMTEKIWDSIENYCLPIYYGEGTNAYELFPKDSFIDYSNFKDPTELFDYINKMTSIEFVNRMNMCLEVYNSISSKGNDFVWNNRKEALDKIIDNFKNITL